MKQDGLLGPAVLAATRPISASSSAAVDQKQADKNAAEQQNRDIAIKLPKNESHQENNDANSSAAQQLPWVGLNPQPFGFNFTATYLWTRTESDGPDIFDRQLAAPLQILCRAKTSSLRGFCNQSPR